MFLGSKDILICTICFCQNIFSLLICAMLFFLIISDALLMESHREIYPDSFLTNKQSRYAKVVPQNNEIELENNTKKIGGGY